MYYSDYVNKARMRFCKDFNIPCNVFDFNLIDNDFAGHQDYFERVVLNTDPKYHEAYQTFVDDINKAGGFEKVDLWLENYAYFRDLVINSLENSEEYKAFNEADIHQWDIEKPCGEANMYSDATDGKTFMSIDLRKANFQALKYAGVISDKYDTYADFIKSFGGSDYFCESKYLRQVIFGKLNPKRTIKVEQFMMKKVYDYIRENEEIAILDDDYKATPAKIFSFNSDEIVFELDSRAGYRVPFEKQLEERIKERLGIEVKVEIVKISRLPVINSHGNRVDAYVRENVNTFEKTLKKASTIYFLQIWKLWKGEDIEYDDLKFFFEDQYAHFDEALRLE